ncbi:MAG: DsbA family protein [Novosphingobium sp.]|nr:DsbA family protein [Novosphingobium sp.]
MPFRAAAATLAALALALAACGKSEDTAGAPATSASPIAKIAAPAGQAWADKIAVTPEGGYLMGNPEAPIELVEYGALSCSHCAEFSETGFAKLRDDYINSGRVSFELRHFMLNPLDLSATLLATCGAPESVIPLSEQFWAWQAQMFSNLQSAGDAQLQAAGALPPVQRFGAIAQLAGMTPFFAERGIAADQAAACLADVDKATALSNATQKASEEKNVTGTPWFFINGRDVGTQSWATLEPMLQGAGAR